VKVTFNFETGSVTTNLDPRLVSDLHDLLSRHAVPQDDVLKLLQRMAFFDDNREKIMGSIPRNRDSALVVYANDFSIFDSEDNAFSWASKNPELSPIYIVNLQAPDGRAE
jgi:hypothetical protein